MEFYLIIAGILTFIIGLAHSYLGERYILIRLLQYSELPKLFGDDSFTRQTLRFAWHLTTLAWWGLAVILFVTSGLFFSLKAGESILIIIALIFFFSALLSLIITKGRHLSWIIYLVIMFLILLAVS